MQQNCAIAFLDPEPHLIKQTIDNLRAVYSPVQVFTGEEELLHFVELARPAIVLISLGYHGGDFLSVLDVLDRSPARMPLTVIYSDRQDGFLQELAFNSGADRFIGFHTNPGLMSAFVKSLIRRRTGLTPKKGIFVDVEAHLVYRDGNAFLLPKKEFQMFRLLYDNPSESFTKKRLAELIWNDLSVVERRTIEVHLSNIRRMLGKDVIVFETGKGYSLRPADR